MASGSSDLRYVDAKTGERVSWLETAHAYWNGWLYKREMDELHAAKDEAEAQALVHKYHDEIQRRLGFTQAYL